MTRLIRVRGRVQGVGFRWFTVGLAQRLGVTGKVWNSRNGSVGAIAQHEDAAQLDVFEGELYDGPGRVDEVISQEWNAGLFHDFGISAEELA